MNAPQSRSLLPRPGALLVAVLALHASALAQLRVVERAAHAGLGLVARQTFYDPVRHLIVGVAADGRTHELDGLGRVSRSADTAGAIGPYPGAPAARLEYSAAFGTRRFENGSWTPVSAAGQLPPIAPDPLYRLSYDTARDRAILAVKVSSVGVTTFWEFDGTSWRSIGFQNGTVVAMCFDPSRLRTAAITNLGFHFDWDGTAWSTGVPVGSQRVLGLAFDRARGRLTLLGDSFVFATHLAEFANGAWVVLPASNIGAPVLNDGTLVYDEVRGTLVIAGGDVAQPAGDALWEWNGGTWSARSASTSHPPAANDAMLAEDPTSGVLLFGGRDAQGVPNAATWLFDGITWSPITSPNAPAARSAAAMTHSGNAGVLLVGGLDAQGQALADTWLWNASAGWQQLFTFALPARLNHALGCDLSAPGGPRVYLFGGTDGTQWFGDLRWLDTSGFPARWRTITTSGAPPARDTHALAVDELRHQLVLFGGRDAQGNVLADTWTFDLVAQSWTQRLPAHAPSPRMNHALVWDRARARVVLLGGYAPQSGFLGDVWDWNGVDWQQRVAESGALGPVENPAACYDGYTQRIVSFGGQPGFGVAPRATTKELTEPAGPIGAAVGQALTLSITSQPLAGIPFAPLTVTVANRNGPAVLLLDFGNAPTPVAAALPPAFCTAQTLWASPQIALSGIGNPTRFVVPAPAAVRGFALTLQGLGLNGGCLDLSNAAFVVLREPN
ncbi:MAG: hypothetical protein IT457_09640 [Planctomycetes bacterium]|nr:hypothetical protein [Planctomycetota bacterium]